MKALSLITLQLICLHPCQAAVSIVDVDSPFGGTKTSDTSFGQTFTPGISGSIDMLRILLVSGLPFNVTIWDFDTSTGTLGKILGSQDCTPPQEMTSYRWVEVAFQTSIPQIAGKTLAFTVTSTSTFGPAISGHSVYPGGDFFEYSGSSSVVPLNRDLTFQTMVTPVPESGRSLIAVSTTLLVLSHRKRKPRRGLR